MVSKEAVRRTEAAAAMFVLDEDERNCGVEDSNRQGGHRERELRVREERRDLPSGTVGSTLPAEVPVFNSEDQGPTPSPDKPGYHEPAHLGPHKS